MYRGSIYSSVTMISPLTNIAILQLFCSFRFIRRFLFVYMLVCSGLVSSFAICRFFSAAFAFPMIRFDGISGSAVAIVSVDSSRLVLFVVSSISAYVKYFHKISCNVAKPIDVTHLLR